MFFFAPRKSALYLLPPYAPELNEIEPVFRQGKYQETPSAVTPPGQIYAGQSRQASNRASKASD